MFKSPALTFKDERDSRFATVTLNFNDERGFVIVRFADPANPDETNSAERDRVIAKAKDLFQSASSAL